MGWTADVHVLPGGTDEKKIAAVPYVDCSYTDRINSFGSGSISFPSDYPRLSEILDPKTDIGSLIWLKRDGLSTDMAFFAQRWSEDVAEDSSRLIQITGPGIGDALLGSIIEPYGTGEALDWIWNGKNILSNPGFEDCRNIVEVYELWNDATSGTFVLHLDAQDTSSLAWNISALDLEIALELLSTMTDCYVEGEGTEADPWRITFADPPYPVAQMTITDSLTGGDSTLAKTTDGSVDPTPWTKVQNVDRGAPPVIATYSSDGWTLQNPASPTPLEGLYTWRVNGLARYAGHQQLVRVTPGMTYQVKVPLYTTDGADQFRVVIRTRMEELIASSTWPGDTVTAVSTWDETTFTITDVVIPDGVTEVIFRFAYVGTDNPDPYYTDYNEMTEGLVATSAGGIMDALLTAAQAKGSLTWLDWNFTDSLDSNSNAWSETALSFVAKRGQSIGQVLGDLAKFGIEFYVFWNGTAWELGLYEPYDYDTYEYGLGTDRSSDDSPSLLLGKGITSGPIQMNTPTANVVYAEGANGLWSEAVDAASVAIWGRLEGYVGDFSVEDQATLDALAQAQLEERSVLYGDKLRLNVLSHQPYDAFDLGDTVQVTLQPRATQTPRRVVGLTTQLPTVENSSPEWEVDLDQASYGPATAIAEGLRRVLTKFNRPPDMELLGSGVPLSLGTGPIEPTYLIASANARDEIKAVADFVCDGIADQEEINAAIALIDGTAIDAGRVVLTDGYFNCTDYISTQSIDVNIRIEGMGMFATYITTDPSTHTLRDSLIALSGDKSSLSYLNIEVADDDYNYVVTVNGTANNPTTIDHCYIAQNATGTDAWGAVDAYTAVNIDQCAITSTANGIYFNSTQSSITDSLFIATGTLNGVDGAAIHLGSAGHGTRVSGNHIESACDIGILAEGADDGIIVGNYAESEIKIKTGSNRHIIVGNQADITIDSGAVDNIVDNNDGTLTDNGTTTKVGAYVTDITAVVKHDNFAQTGALTIGSGTVRYYTQTDRTITGVYAMVSGAPVTSPAIFDVNMDGATTIFTTQANRPEIAATEYLSAVEVPDVTAWDAGSYLLIDVDAANSATDLILVVQYTEA